MNTGRWGSISAALISVTALAADPMHVIIFAGGVTEADGAAALASFKKLEATVAQVVTLPAGEPKVVDSSKFPGLKPGFKVVTLGVCRTPGPVLASLKAIYPGTYSKALTGDVGPERCPTVGEQSADAYEPPVKLGTSVLNAFRIHSAEEGSSSTLGFVLVEKSTGLVRSVATTDGASIWSSGEGPTGHETGSCDVTVTAEKAGFLVARDCSDERTGCNLGERAIPKKWSETVRVSVKGDAIVVGSTRKNVTDKNPCVAGSSEGD